MKKKIVLAILSSLLFLLLGIGIAKLYISYNLSYYAGYYVQQLPRKEGTNPEMVLLLENLDFGPNVEVDGITYDTDGNGAIIKDNLYLTYRSDYVLWLPDRSQYFKFNRKGEFIGYFEYSPKTILMDDKYKAEAQVYLDELLPPILEAQPRPSINLQWLFNQKYEKRFN